MSIYDSFPTAAKSSGPPLPDGQAGTQVPNLPEHAKPYHPAASETMPVPSTVPSTSLYGDFGSAAAAAAPPTNQAADGAPAPSGKPLIYGTQFAPPGAGPAADTVEQPLDRDEPAEVRHARLASQRFAAPLVNSRDDGRPTEKSFGPLNALASMGAGATDNSSVVRDGGERAASAGPNEGCDPYASSRAAASGGATERRPSASSAGTAATRTGCGCGSCLLGCGTLVLVAVIACAGAAWFVHRSWPGWLRQTVVAQIEPSTLKPDDKAAVLEEFDYLFGEFRAGRLSSEQIGAIGQQLAKSPVTPLLMADAAMGALIEPSGLSDDERQQAHRALHRVARGYAEGQINAQQLGELAAHVLIRNANDQMALNPALSDDDRRQFISRCVSLADELQIAPNEFEVNVRHELRTAILSVQGDDA